MTSMIQIPSSALVVLQPETNTFEEHFVVRFPPSLAASVRSDLQETGLSGDLEISFNQKDHRLAKVSFDGRVYTAVLCDLPTILETHKTSDRSQYVKVADVHQVLLVLDGNNDQIKTKIEELRSQDFKLDDGLTPPMKNVRNKRFSNKAAENAKRMEEIEAQVKALIEADERAASSNITLYDSRGRPVQLDKGRRKKKAGQQGDVGDQESVTVAGQDDQSNIDFDGHAEAESARDMQSQMGMEDEGDSGDSDFAAELEEDLLEQSTVDQRHLGEAIADMQLSTDTIQQEQENQHTADILPPELTLLKKQIADKTAQLSTVANPAIRKRLEDAIAYLEQQLSSKMANL